MLHLFSQGFYQPQPMIDKKLVFVLFVFLYFRKNISLYLPVLKES